MSEQEPSAREVVDDIVAIRNTLADYLAAIGAVEIANLTSKDPVDANPLHSTTNPAFFEGYREALNHLTLLITSSNVIRRATENL